MNQDIRKILVGLVGLVLLASCKKDIEIDYHQVNPLYVVEASVSNEGMKARISMTNDMDDNTTTSDISGATVTITGSDGSSVNLPYINDGTYRSATKGTPGVTYTIDIEVDGNHFSSSSTMQKMPTLNKFHFSWMKILNTRMLIGEVLVQDIPDEDNWYFTHLYRNNKGYRWSLMRGDLNPDGQLQSLYSIGREDDDDEDMLREGDRLRLELRSIDRKTYDYLYSMQLMGDTGNNPLPDFTGGCLGYFSAYSQVTCDVVFHKADVEEEEEDEEEEE